MAPDLLLREQRIPGRPMVPCPIKLPADQLQRLQEQAERLQTFPSALARALICRGLDSLDGPTPGPPAPDR